MADAKPLRKKKGAWDEADELRRGAEERLDALAAAASAASPSAPVPEELTAAVHELRVHQIELEMQNEELRRAQFELEAQREKYFELFDLAPVGYVTLSDEGIVGNANLTAAHLLGVERQLLVGQPFSAFVSTPDRDVFYLHHRALQNTREPQACELRLRRAGDKADPEAGADGEAAPAHFWAHLEGRPEHATPDEPPSYWVTFNDIDERKQIEGTLLESEALMRGLFDTMPSGCAIYEVRNDGSKGSDYIVKQFNSKSLKLEEKTLDEVVGKSLYDLRPAIDDYGLIPVFQRVWQTGMSALLSSKVYVDEHYSNYYENRVFRLPSNEIVAIYDDVTERVVAGEAVAESAEQLRATLHDTVRAFGEIVGLRDPYTALHEKGVTRLADAIAVDLGLNDKVREGLMLAAEVHDVGKISVPAEILSKPAALTEMERRLVEQHALAGRQVLSGIGFQQPVAEIVGQHHERLDGSGYPDGLRADEIMLEARIIGVADVVEAMASHRPYRSALGMDAALAEVRAGAGRRYDAAVVAACERVIAAGFSLDDTDEDEQADP